MTTASAAIDDPSALRGELSEADARTLEERNCVRTGDDVYWVEPTGRLRKERASRLYYSDPKQSLTWVA